VFLNKKKQPKNIDEKLILDALVKVAAQITVLAGIAGPARNRLEASLDRISRAVQTINESADEMNAVFVEIVARFGSFESSITDAEAKSNNLISQNLEAN
jgi:hypothetical protein